jgi:hypothetical protein
MVSTVRQTNSRRPQHPITPGAGNLCAVVLTTMDMRNKRLRDASSELLAQGLHCCSHLR